MLITNPTRKKQIKEFIDKDRAVMDEYYTIFDSEMTKAEVRKLMYSLIRKDPDFYDTYGVLAYLYWTKGAVYEAGLLLKRAYQRAVNRIVDSQGRWPQKISWLYMGNRHVMRIIDRYALYCWETGNTQEALFIYRKLLKMCPKDNVGARFSILAIHLKFSFKEWEALFASKDGGGLNAIKMDKWFDNNAGKFPEDLEDYIVDRNIDDLDDLDESHDQAA